MERSEEAALLADIRDLLQQGRASQLEALELIRAQAERSRAAVDRSVAMQELAMRRQKGILALVLPILLVCLGTLAWLLFKYYR